MGIEYHDPGHHLSFQTDRSLGKRNGPPSTDVREAQAWTSGRRLEEQNATRLETRTSGPYGVHSTQHAMNNEYLTGPSFSVFCSVFAVRGSVCHVSVQVNRYSRPRLTASKSRRPHRSWKVSCCSWYSQFRFLIRLDHPHLNCREIVTYASELNAPKPSICKPHPGISTIGSPSLVGIHKSSCLIVCAHPGPFFFCSTAKSPPRAAGAKSRRTASVQSNRG